MINVPAVTFLVHTSDMCSRAMHIALLSPSVQASYNTSHQITHCGFSQKCLGMLFLRFPELSTLSCKGGNIHSERATSWCQCLCKTKKQTAVYLVGRLKTFNKHVHFICNPRITTMCACILTPVNILASSKTTNLIGSSW